MNSLVSFDQAGAIGPAFTILFNSMHYNEKRVLDLTELLKENFMKLTRAKMMIKPKGKKDFCKLIKERNQMDNPLKVVDIIRTRFFQSMQSKEISPLHDKVKELMASRILTTIGKYFPQRSEDREETEIVEEWLTGLLESYVTEEQIAKYCEAQDSLDNNSEIQKERERIGLGLYNTIKDKQFTENDLDLFLRVTQIAIQSLKDADHFASVLNFTGEYLRLFSMNEKDPVKLSEDILCAINTSLRTKFFPKT